LKESFDVYFDIIDELNVLVKDLKGKQKRPLKQFFAAQPWAKYELIIAKNSLKIILQQLEKDNDTVST
jgi:hypothetical protein